MASPPGEDPVETCVAVAVSVIRATPTHRGDPVTPDPLLKLATEYLVASYAYMRIESSQKKKVKFGNVEITNSTGKDSSSLFFFNKYMDLIRQLNEGANGGAIWGESHVLI